MRNTAGVLKETGTAYPSSAPEFTPGFLCGLCCSSVQHSVLCLSVALEFTLGFNKWVSC